MLYTLNFTALVSNEESANETSTLPHDALTLCKKAIYSCFRGEKNTAL